MGRMISKSEFKYPFQLTFNKEMKNYQWEVCIKSILTRCIMKREKPGVSKNMESISGVKPVNSTLQDFENKSGHSLKKILQVVLELMVCRGVQN